MDQAVQRYDTVQLAEILNRLVPELSRSSELAEGNRVVPFKRPA